MAPATGWFATRELERGVWLVAEPVHVNCFLVAGRERAVLIDSGLGIADIRPIVESLTDLDVMVANTHHHWDHVGGTIGSPRSRSTSSVMSTCGPAMTLRSPGST